MDKKFDVIIVGGRPAGASLAIRLGEAGARVLLLEKETFPLPHPFSTPIVYSSALEFMDELGMDEAEYARNTPRITRWANEIYGEFRTLIEIPTAFGRNYAYAIDRARFDHAMWQKAESTSGVTAYQPFFVKEVITNFGGTMAIKGSSSGKKDKSFTASCIIGADGRYSTVANQMGALDLAGPKNRNSTVYYASWENAQPYDEHGSVVHFYQPLESGYIFFLFDGADGLVNVAMEGRPSAMNLNGGSAESFYEAHLQKYPGIWRRLKSATRVTKLHGIRDVGNFYRTSHGPGWALTGDALHQKDPLTGQGIFDALVGAKLLSHALTKWLNGQAAWDQSMQEYDGEFKKQSLAMFTETVNQVGQTLYSRVPSGLSKLFYRLAGLDFELNDRYAKLITRSIPAENWLPPATILRALGRGIAANIQYAIQKRPHPNEYFS